MPNSLPQVIQLRLVTQKFLIRNNNEIVTVHEKLFWSPWFAASRPYAHVFSMNKMEQFQLNFHSKPHISSANTSYNSNKLSFKEYNTPLQPLPSIPLTRHFFALHWTTEILETKGRKKLGIVTWLWIHIHTANTWKAGWSDNLHVLLCNTTEERQLQFTTHLSASHHSFRKTAAKSPPKRSTHTTRILLVSVFCCCGGVGGRRLCSVHIHWHSKQWARTTSVTRPIRLSFQDFQQFHTRCFLFIRWIERERERVKKTQCKDIPPGGRGGLCGCKKGMCVLWWGATGKL